MTDTAETFRQGAMYYRNARDWAKEQREEAIRLANLRAMVHQAQSVTVETSVGRTSTCPSDGTVEVESRPDEESRSLLDETSNTRASFQDSDDASSDELAAETLPIKRPSRLSKRTGRDRRKRHNAGIIDENILEQAELQASDRSGLTQQFGNQGLEQELDGQLTDGESSQ